MPYTAQDFLDSVEGNRIFEFSQSDFLTDFDSGICCAITHGWLYLKCQEKISTRASSKRKIIEGIDDFRSGQNEYVDAFLNYERDELLDAAMPECADFKQKEPLLKKAGFRLVKCPSISIKFAKRASATEEAFEAAAVNFAGELKPHLKPNGFGEIRLAGSKSAHSTGLLMKDVTDPDYFLDGKAGTISFFDPNLGEYRFDSTDALCRFIAGLVYVIYKTEKYNDFRIAWYSKSVVNLPSISVSPSPKADAKKKSKSAEQQDPFADLIKGYYASM